MHVLVSVQHVQAYTISIIIIFRKSVTNKLKYLSQYKIHGNFGSSPIVCAFHKWGPWSNNHYFSYGLLFAKGKPLQLEQLVWTLIQFKLEWT